MHFQFQPARLSGSVVAPPSKSEAHRYLIAASLCEGKSVIKNIAFSQDILSTMRVLSALGTTFTQDGDALTVIPGKNNKRIVADCGESGTTMRLLLSVLGALGVEVCYEGRGKLPERPYLPLTEELSRHGLSFDRTSGMPLCATGRLQSGYYLVDATVSSQYLSGLLFALPLLEGDSFLELMGTPVSKAYLSITLSVLRAFGITVEERENGYAIRGGQCYRAGEFTVEGDWSNAAFWLVAGAISGDVTVSGLNVQSAQGDRVILDILTRAGASVSVTGYGARVQSNRLLPISVNVEQCTDLMPVLSVLLSACGGLITGASRMKWKECDRLTAMHCNLRAAGVQTQVTEDMLFVPRQVPRQGSALLGYNDHRVVMSAALLGLMATLSVSDTQAVCKSYPDFFEEYMRLGGIVCPLV